MADSYLSATSDFETDLDLNATSSETGGGAIALLHHNPHWECFERDGGKCRNNAWGQYSRFLQSYKIDFGGLVMGGTYEPPEGWQKLEHLSRKDRAALIFNTQEWNAEAYAGGQFEAGRAFVVARFGHKKRRTKVVVIAAHYSHSVSRGRSLGAHNLKAVVKLLQDGTNNTILLADTNQNLRQKNNHGLLREIGVASERTWAHDPLGTCCLDSAFGGGGMSYDRIAANFGRSMRTIKDPTYLNETNGYKKGPAWAYHAKTLAGKVAAYHHPLLARLEL